MLTSGYTLSLQENISGRIFQLLVLLCTHRSVWCCVLHPPNPSGSVPLDKLQKGCPRAPSYASLNPISIFHSVTLKSQLVISLFNSLGVFHFLNLNPAQLDLIHPIATASNSWKDNWQGLVTPPCLEDSLQDLTKEAGLHSQKTSGIGIS